MSNDAPAASEIPGLTALNNLAAERQTGNIDMPNKREIEILRRNWPHDAKCLDYRDRERDIYI